MNRSVLLALAVCCSCSSLTNGDDYLLRVDAVGYVDQPASEKDPKETLLGSVEVVVRPESAFHSKVSIGTQTLIVAGKLRPAERGSFAVQIRFVQRSDTGISVLTADGSRKSVPDESVVQTQITVALDQSVTIGCLESSESGSGKPVRHSKSRYVVVLAKYQPTDD